MRETTKETKTVHIATKIICDKCKATEEIGKLNTDYVIEFNHNFGYGSSHDLQTLKFDLCEKCLFDILRKENINYTLK